LYPTLAQVRNHSGHAPKCLLTVGATLLYDVQCSLQPWPKVLESHRQSCVSWPAIIALPGSRHRRPARRWPATGRPRSACPSSETRTQAQTIDKVISFPSHGCRVAALLARQMRRKHNTYSEMVSGSGPWLDAPFAVWASPQSCVPCAPQACVWPTRFHQIDIVYMTYERVAR